MPKSLNFKKVPHGLERNF